MRTKRCTGECGEVKPLEEFGNNKLYKDGKTYWCKACSNKHLRTYNKTHPNKRKARSKLATANRKRTKTLYDKFIDYFRALALQADVLEISKEERIVILKKEDWSNTCLIGTQRFRSFQITWV